MGGDSAAVVAVATLLLLLLVVVRVGIGGGRGGTAGIELGLSVVVVGIIALYGCVSVLWCGSILAVSSKQQPKKPHVRTVAPSRRSTLAQSSQCPCRRHKPAKRIHAAYGFVWLVVDRGCVCVYMCVYVCGVWNGTFCEGLRGARLVVEFDTKTHEKKTETHNTTHMQDGVYIYT